MAAIVKRYTYEFDPTGRQPANLIRNERHTITPQNRTPQNVLIPGFAPFFRQSLIVTDMNTGLPLREGIDYTVEWPIIDTSNNTEGYTPLYLGIQFVDNSITGQFELQYQTLGGQWALDGVAIAQALANTANDPLTTEYHEIIGRPIKLPPLEHVHSIDDFVGFDDLCQEVTLLRESIELLAREDRDAHPGYDTLIDEYFRLSQYAKDVAGDVTKLQNKVDKDIAAAIKETADNLAQARREINEQLNTTTTDLTGKLNQLRDNTTNSLNDLRTQVTNKLAEQNTNLTGLINQAKAEASTRATDIENKFNTYKGTTNNTLSEHDRRITEAYNRGADWNVNLRNIPSTLLYSTMPYVRATAGSNGWGGFEVMKDGVLNRFEVSPQGNFKLMREATGSNPQINIDFPLKSGTVAYEADVVTKINSAKTELNNLINSAKNELNNALNALRNQVGTDLQNRLKTVENKFNEYVRKSGDTMSGRLNVPDITVGGILLSKNTNPPGGGAHLLQIHSRVQIDDLYIN